jgi:hypothetical protein
MLGNYLGWSIWLNCTKRRDHILPPPSLTRLLLSDAILGLHPSLYVSSLCIPHLSGLITLHCADISGYSALAQAMGSLSLVEEHDHMVPHPQGIGSPAQWGENCV